MKKGVSLVTGGAASESGRRFMRHRLCHIRTSHERSGEHGAEAQLLADAPEFIKYPRVDVFDHVELLPFRLKILADGENLTADIEESLHDPDDFVVALAQSKHQSRLCDDRRIETFHFGK